MAGDASVAAVHLFLPQCYGALGVSPEPLRVLVPRPLPLLTRISPPRSPGLSHSSLLFYFETFILETPSWSSLWSPLSAPAGASCSRPAVITKCAARPRRRLLSSRSSVPLSILLGCSSAPLLFSNSDVSPSFSAHHCTFVFRMFIFKVKWKSGA